MSPNNFGYSVQWSDFTKQASRPSNENEDAHIEVKFPFNYGYDQDKNAWKITSVDMNIMVTDESWVVDSKMTNDLLKHEQGHFDITAIGARELYNKLLTVTAATEQKLKEAKAKENENFQRKINAANRRYDTQTYHSQDTAQQNTWDNAIAAEKQKPDGSLNNLPQ